MYIYLLEEPQLRRLRHPRTLHVSTTTTRRSGRTGACLFGSCDTRLHNIKNCDTIMAKDIIDVADLFEDDIDEKAL